MTYIDSKSERYFGGKSKNGKRESEEGSGKPSPAGRKEKQWSCQISVLHWAFPVCSWLSHCDSFPLVTVCFLSRAMQTPYWLFLLTMLLVWLENTVIKGTCCVLIGC